MVSRFNAIRKVAGIIYLYRTIIGRDIQDESDSLFIESMQQRLNNDFPILPTRTKAVSTLVPVKAGESQTDRSQEPFFVIGNEPVVVSNSGESRIPVLERKHTVFRFDRRRSCSMKRFTSDG